MYPILEAHEWMDDNDLDKPIAKEEDKDENIDPQFVSCKDYDIF